MCCRMCTSVPSGIGGDSKMYTPSTIAHSQITPTKINKCAAIAKVRILVEQVIGTIRHIKILRIISHEMPVLRLMLMIF